jgi:putative ABC transport system substrate-binding protein
MFRLGLREQGFEEGRDIQVDYRFAQGDSAALAEATRALVEEGVKALVLADTQAVSAARRATKSIPLIVTNQDDPVGRGDAASLSRPGGNMTGLTTLVHGTAAKKLELLIEAAPHVTYVGVLSDSDSSSADSQWPELEAAAASLNVRLAPLQLDLPRANRPDLDDVIACSLTVALSEATSEGVNGLYVLGNPIVNRYRATIVGIAANHRIPVIAQTFDWTAAGGLMSYSVDLSDLSRRAAGYVAKVVRGADPGEIPIEQPTRFRLAVNLTTAEQIGLRLSESILLRATDAIRIPPRAVGESDCQEPDANAWRGSNERHVA